MTRGELEELQFRIAHQELAIETLNETVVRQEQLINELRGEMARIRQALRDLQPSPVDGPSGHEPPPPHY